MREKEYRSAMLGGRSGLDGWENAERCNVEGDLERRGVEGLRELRGCQDEASS